MLNHLLARVMIEAKSNRNPSTCISVTQYLHFDIFSLSEVWQYIRHLRVTRTYIVYKW